MKELGISKYHKAANYNAIEEAQAMISGVYAFKIMQEEDFVKNIEFQLYDGKVPHGKASQKIQTIFKPKKQSGLPYVNTKGKVEYAPVYGTHSCPLFYDDHKPVGNLNVRYVFVPSLLANKLEKGKACEYDTKEKFDKIFEEARLASLLQKKKSWFCC